MVCVCTHLHIKRESPKSTVKSHLINLPNFCCSLYNKYYALCLNLQACFWYISLLTDIKRLKFSYKTLSMVFTGQTEDSRAVWHPTSKWATALFGRDLLETLCPKSSTSFSGPLCPVWPCEIQPGARRRRTGAKETLARKWKESYRKFNRKILLLGFDGHLGW